MPLFGSGAGSSAQGACAKLDEETSMGARLKEDAGLSATTGGIGPQKNDGSSRESSPGETCLITTEDETGMPCYSVYN